ncbi:MAG TPA: pantoate--beta-alanine ligase [Terriglobia bacterium]|nr:pantoate--beta-alanine ligase [Terriglobia bacterium]
MRTVHTVKEVRDFLESKKNIGLVPTMGALHAGHERLLETARRESDVLVVSIFVNPLQFGPNEDYARYPRTLSHDLETCERNRVDLVFAPSAEEMYSMPQLTSVDVGRLSEHLCAKFRPGHFRAVATVVMKLLNIVQPQRAYFGEKDLQQLTIIRRMAADLNVNVTIVGVPIVRETDGLALSSRNKYLNVEERKAAPVLYRALQEASSRVRSGEKDASRVREAALAVLANFPLIRVEYLEIVDPDELQPIATIGGPVRIAGAIWVGATRLIDNVTA